MLGFFGFRFFCLFCFVPLLAVEGVRACVCERKNVMIVVRKEKK
jgi:hypothetical protein